jgi:hypothetical protein
MFFKKRKVSKRVKSKALKIRGSGFEPWAV